MELTAKGFIPAILLMVSGSVAPPADGDVQICTKTNFINQNSVISYFADSDNSCNQALENDLDSGVLKYYMENPLQFSGFPKIIDANYSPGFSWPIHIEFIKEGREHEQ